MNKKKFSDSVYTERYLGLLNKSEANYKGYQDANLCNKFNSLSEQEQEKPRDPEKQKKKKQKKMFYLVHGTSDNNVQFQHSMTLARHLAKKDILFQQQVKKNVRDNIFFFFYINSKAK